MAKSPCSLLRAVIPGLILLFLSPQCFAQVAKTLYGKIETQGGAAIGRAVQATLEPQDGGPVLTAPVDSDGNFQFNGLWPQIFNLTVKADGFQTYRQSEDLSDALRVDYHVLIFMSAVEETKNNPAEEPSLTDMAAPKNARQEFENAKRDWQRHMVKDEQRHLEKAVEDYPCYARAQTVLADLESAQKDFSDAEAGYKKAIKCDGTYLRAAHGLASLYLAENKPSDSEAVLLQALRTAPSDWMSLYELGAAQFAMSKYESAEHDFLSAQSFHSQMPPSFHVRLADAYLKTGKNDKALAEIDTYLHLSPDGPYAASARRMAAVLRGRGVNEKTAPPEPPSTIQP